MLFPITLFLIVALFVFGYHYERNGNPLNLGDFGSRLIWSGIFAFGYSALAFPHIDFFLLGWYGVAAFLEILIPHAFAQNMGRWPAPWSVLSISKYWPGFWLPSYTQEAWTALSPSKRTRIDFLGMLSVGVLRGIVVFVPGIWLGAGLFASLVAFGITAIWQPMSYFLGYYVPFNIFGNTKNSATWGEFGIGIGWAFALAAIVRL